MTTPAGPLETVFRVGHRFRVRMRIDLAKVRRGAVDVLEAEGDPVPWRPLSRRELRDWRRGRDAFLAEIARHIGGGVAVMEPPPHGPEEHPQRRESR